MALPVDEALARILGSVAGRPAAESVPCADAIGRVSAEEVTAPFPLPPFANSAMDGYAVRAADTAAASPDAPARLALAGESRAGAPAGAVLPPGAAMRISTGAAMPGGADAVLRVEDAAVDAGTLVVRAPLAAGHDVRPAGDDVAAGDAVLAPGMRVGAGELAMLASVGRTEVAVARRPRVAVVATGDETVPPGAPLRAGAIHDSNSPMLAALARSAGAEVVAVRAGVADDAGATRAALAAALDAADVVLVAGGVSKGAHDHVKPALADLGVREAFWQVALRPGHPTWFGVRDAGDGRRLVFGLPGNPVSAWVTFHLFAAPALAALQGDARPPLELAARWTGDAVRSPVEATQVLRCVLGADGDGAVSAAPNAANQRSHAVSSLVGVDALAFVPPGVAGLAPGDPVRVRPLPR